MTLQELKKIVKITDVLGIQNIEKNEFFIKSPFRDEKTPSFKINILKNIWYDFGTGEGGSVLDLIIKIKKCDTKEAVKILKDLANDTNSFPFSPANCKVQKQEQEQNKIEIKKIDELKNKALLEYLCSRKIDINIAKSFLKDVYFTKENKHYFGVGFKNNSEGFEIRNKYIKMCILKKDITTISKNSDKVAIFEGFLDFLSALTYYKKDDVSSDVIVLNSLSLLNKTDLSKYKKINLFLDNDKAGREAKVELCRRYPNKYIKDYSYIYKNFKDFNEFLQNNFHHRH